MTTMPPDLAPRLRAALRARPPRRLRVRGARDAAVLIPVVGGDEPSLLFTVRSETLSSHSGQISFPGGRIDPGDASPAAAAVREAHEEIGLDPNEVEIVGELDWIQTYVSGYVVVPVVGWLPARAPLRPNPAEVARVLDVPLAKLSDAIRANAGFTHAGRTYPTEAWVYDDDVIWGVTARILRSFLGRLADAGLAARPSEERSRWAAR
jgi:8-oxo-dGTP pyrophosphatase MutT (NUDIX family)